MSDRNTWVSESRQAVTKLDNLGITLPTNVSDAVEALRRVESMQPAKPDQTALREAYLASADPATLTAVLLADIGFPRLNSEWSQARITAAGRVLAALRASVDEVMPPLRDQADAAIGKLRAVADIGPGVKIETLIRSGNDAAARNLADVDIVAAELTTLYRFRDDVLVPGGGLKLSVNGVNCGQFRDPDAAAAHARGKTVADQWIAALQAGVELWYPSPAEAIATATTIANQRAAAAKLKASREHGVGSTVFMSA